MFKIPFLKLSNNLYQWMIIVCMANSRLQLFSMLFVLLTTEWRKKTSLIILILVLFAHSLLSTTLVGYSMGKALQQIILIAIYWTGIWSFFVNKVNYVEEIWEKYLKFCYIIGIFGLLQLLCIIIFSFDPFFFTFNGSVATNRLHSFLGEPAGMATFLVPAVSYYILNFKKEKIKETFIIFFVFLMAFSSACMVSFVLLLIYKLLMSKYKYVPILILPFFLIGIYLIKERAKSEEKNDTNKTFKIIEQIEDISGEFSAMNPEDLELLSASTYATMANLWVAANAPLRLTGTGIGTHEQNYLSLYKETSSPIWGLNKEDAYAMGTRLYSEFGLMGIGFLLILVFKLFNKDNLINISTLFYIFSVMIRGGNYAGNGVFFFFILFYLTGKRRKSISLT